MEVCFLSSNGSDNSEKKPPQDKKESEKTPRCRTMYFKSGDEAGFRELELFANTKCWKMGLLPKAVGSTAKTLFPFDLTASFCCDFKTHIVCKRIQINVSISFAWRACSTVKLMRSWIYLMRCEEVFVERYRHKWPIGIFRYCENGKLETNSMYGKPTVISFSVSPQSHSQTRPLALVRRPTAFAKDTTVLQSTALPQLTGFASITIND